MPEERSHQEAMAWDAQQHTQAEAEKATPRAYELELIKAKAPLELAQEANRSTEATARIAAQVTSEATQQAFEHESMRAWRKGRVRLIYGFVGVWLAMVGASLAGGLLSEAIRQNVAYFVGIIGMVTGVATAAAAVLYSQGYFQAQRGEGMKTQENKDED